MTIQKAIDTAMILKSDEFNIAIKVDWLSHLDAKIQTELIDTHDDLPRSERNKKRLWQSPIDFYPNSKCRKERNTGKINFEPYSKENLGQTLLVPFPFDELYPRFIIMKADETHEDGSYNASAVIFNELYQKYANWYNENYKAL